MAPDDSGQNVGGLPNIFIFGMHLLPQHLLLVLGAAALFGWRGLLVGGIVCEAWDGACTPVPCWYPQHAQASEFLKHAIGHAAADYVYSANQQPQRSAAPSQADTSRRMADAQDYFGRMLGQPPLGRGGAAAGGSPAPARPAAADAWAARGKPRKLTDD
jgi:hypothetical protein